MSCVPRLLLLGALGVLLSPHRATGQEIPGLRGAEPPPIVLSNGESLEDFLQKRDLLAFDLHWYSVDGGGAILSGGLFRLAGIVGQTDTAVLSAGSFRMIGGFFAAIQPPVATPCRGGDLIFCDGFESGALQGWSQVVSGN